MTYKGHVEQGTIVLDEPVDLPDGISVSIEVLHRGQETAHEIPSLYERLGSIMGIAEGMPPDASASIDDVLYGKRPS